MVEAIVPVGPVAPVAPVGLCWADIDYEHGLVRVHRQLTRYREHGPPKTPSSKREVILAPAIARQLTLARLPPQAAQRPRLLQP
jgi:hypothetical protein